MSPKRWLFVCPLVASSVGAAWIGYNLHCSKQRESEMLVNKAGMSLPLSTTAKALAFLVSKNPSLHLWDSNEQQKIYNLNKEIKVLTSTTWQETKKTLYSSQTNLIAPEAEKYLFDMIKEEEKVEASMYNDPSAHLSSLGKFMMKTERNDRLAHRKQIIEFAEQNSDITNSPPIDSRMDGTGLIAILGQHRTGSTLLQNLLALDPNSRSPLLWHQLAMPPPFTAEKKKEMERKLSVVNFVCPGYFQKMEEMHPFGLESPEEDVVMLYHLGLGFHEITLFNNTNAELWFEKHHQMIGAYRMRYLHLCLKIMDSAFSDKKRWIIKNPDHSNYLLSFMNEFPQAKIIYTHREPETIIPSLATTLLYAQHIAMYNPFSEAPYSATAEGFGESMVRHCLYATQRLVRDRKFLRENDPERSENQIIDIGFYELVSDPVGTVEKIYHKFGFEFTDEHKQSILAYVNQERPKRKPYHLETFGLTAAQIQHQFSHYREEFADFLK